MKTLPIPIFEHPYQGLPHEQIFACVAFALAICDSVALAIVVLRLRSEPEALPQSFIVCLACVLALLSLLAPAMSTSDPYEYAATGLLGFHAYAPPARALDGTVYAPYRTLIPLKGVIYGPLWLLIDTAQTALGSSLYQKIEAIRITNAAFVALLAALLARARVSRAALVAITLNPCIWFYSVANAHADIEAIVLLAAAFGFARRSRTGPAIAFVVAAGLIKLPFAISGAVVLAPLPGVSRRVAAWIASLALVLIISYSVSGPEYFADLSHFAARGKPVLHSIGWILVALTIASATVALVFWRRSLFGAEWLFAQMSPIAFPQYVFWGLPYALTTATFEVYAVAMPVAASLLDEAARLEAAWQAVAGVVFIAAMSDIYFSNRRRAHVPIR